MNNKIDLSLCIWDYLDTTHEDLTALMELEPYKVYIIGQKKRPNSTALAKNNGWIYKQKEKDDYAPFREQMDAYINILEPKMDVLKSLSAKYCCEFSCALYIYTDKEESTPWVHLEKKDIDFLNRCGVEIDFDILLLAD